MITFQEIPLHFNLSFQKVSNKVVFTIAFLFFMDAAYSQFKVIKIPSEDIYINYFYKQKQTKRNKNDSIYFLCKTVSPTQFFLEKYLNGQKVFRKKYKIVMAKDGLNVNERVRDSTGATKIIQKKALYYNAVEMVRKKS